VPADIAGDERIRPRDRTVDVRFRGEVHHCVYLFVAQQRCDERRTGMRYRTQENPGKSPRELLVRRCVLGKIPRVQKTLMRFFVYFLLALGLAVTVAAGSALAIDLDQFRYATI
jgi:hypothetical protein